VSVISLTAPFNRSGTITESHMYVGGNEIQAAWVTLQSNNNLLIKCYHVKNKPGLWLVDRSRFFFLCCLHW